MYIKREVSTCHEVTKLSFCGGLNYVISGRLPQEYHYSNVIDLAGLNNDLSSNKIVQLHHGFKSVHENYTIAFLEHACTKKDQFVEILPVEKISDLAIYLPSDLECVFVCFIGKESPLGDSI